MVLVIETPDKVPGNDAMNIEVYNNSMWIMLWYAKKA